MPAWCGILFPLRLPVCTGTGTADLLSGSLTAVLSKPGISGGGAGYQAPGQDYQPPVYPPVGTPLKSKMAAGLLGIFLGAFGVHNFYLGYTTKAVIQLCLTLLSCGILSFASGIWGFIEGIMLLTGSINVDGNGMPLQQ